MSCSWLGRVRERCAWFVQAGHPQRQYRTVGTELIRERVEGGGPGCVSHLTNIKKKKDTQTHTLQSPFCDAESQAVDGGSWRLLFSKPLVAASVAPGGRAAGASRSSRTTVFVWIGFHKAVRNRTRGNHGYLRAATALNILFPAAGSVSPVPRGARVCSQSVFLA